MPAAAKEETLPSPMVRNGEEIFFLAAGVDVAALETRQGANTVRGEKSHQGIFFKNRTIAVGAMWVKWSGTHQDSGRWWRKTVLGSALDANGNTLSDPSGKQYTWDFENRLVQVVNPSVGTTAFRYDPFGKRIQKSGPLGTTNYLYSGPNLLEEVDQNGNILARYTRTKRIDEALATLRSGTTNYFERDGLGTVTSLSSPTGGIANSYTYDSFGKLTGSTGTFTNPFQYTGREFDSESGLYYYRARYYDPSIGRFIGEDPTGFTDGTNFYDYAANNPIVFIDPMGLWHCVGGANCDLDSQVMSNLDCFDRCTHCNTAITSGRRPPTPTNQGAHSRGEACDAGRNNNPCLTPDTTRTCFLQCFPNGYCQEERNEGPGTHFHLQLNHVPGGTTRCAPGIQPYTP